MNMSNVIQLSSFQTKTLTPEEEIDVLSDQIMKNLVNDLKNHLEFVTDDMIDCLKMTNETIRMVLFSYHKMKHPIEDILKESK